ncbi:complex 1 protein (LYR family) domain-containing protein [Purpureocillium lilacinum]|uniref:Mitochondrial zinc maintenance protein 1, mitochondrial n=1 Tax=Purpureocillium lilacinum TaxID=33203 RepID=A0A179GG83_PURLI|nr:complex 1 protein (LYR family) domain-containing protein [Purpureocillium lilacinum]OAQ76836.1 complex 1 protein (LYR family) domain-containing protein [Purpureocillium lilacinum]GJN81729.1 mitochondrial zinc maintenance protein 1, mitochondrial [Purpureocillium lilacinum]
MALVAYRNLLRAARIAFQGDAPVLAAAQDQIRHEFRQRSALDSSSSDTQAALQHADEVAKILRENVVQGKRAVDEEATYKLRIHEHTERGDNESIKMGSMGTLGGGGGCGCK